MNKILLAFISTILVSSLFAQVDTLYQTDFSQAAAFSFESSTGMDWIVDDMGPGSANAVSMGPINSSSGGDFALFDSGAFGSSGNVQLSTIWVNEYIDCSAHPYIYVCFESYYKHNIGSPRLNVALTSNATFGHFVHFGADNFPFTTANPESMLLDITQNAAGEDSVKIGFTFSGSYSYAWMIDDLCVIGSDTPLIVGLDESNINHNSFSVYPNPSTGRFTVDMNGIVGAAHIRITDLQGRIVKEEIVNSDVNPLSFLLDEAPGAYVISITDDNGESITRIVKK